MSDQPLDGVSEAKLKQLAENTPDPNAPIQPSKISDTKPPSLGDLDLRVQILESRLAALETMEAKLEALMTGQKYVG